MSELHEQILPPCPLCLGCVERSRITARIVCRRCDWEFVPPGYGAWTPERAEAAWREAQQQAHPPRYAKPEPQEPKPELREAE